MLDRVSTSLAVNIKAKREARNLTQARLAKTSGVPRPTIANLESGTANPTLLVLVKIAAALQVSIEELIVEPTQETYRYAAAALPSEKRVGTEVRNLIPDGLATLEWNRLELGATASLEGTLHGAGTREYLACESGGVELRLDGEAHQMSSGDVICFRGDRPHSYTCRGRRSATLYSAVVLLPVGA
ncbi:MAG: helix-turn-helix transcriptional regulator [Polyangiaceae bacterium]|nr:helix-turn-helix transcriptional regulator [Polyangiaceae bacterium]